MGNILADADGVGKLEMNDPVIKLEGPRSIRGRSVVLHVREDDLTSQPSGESGARIACGVIGLAPTQEKQSRSRETALPRR